MKMLNDETDSWLLILTQTERWVEKRSVLDGWWTRTRCSGFSQGGLLSCGTLTQRLPCQEILSFPTTFFSRREVPEASSPFPTWKSLQGGAQNVSVHVYASVQASLGYRHICQKSFLKCPVSFTSVLDIFRSNRRTLATMIQQRFIHFSILNLWRNAGIYPSMKPIRSAWSQVNSAGT